MENEEIRQYRRSNGYNNVEDVRKLPKTLPKKDKTGPQGKGPRTGRGLGDCPKLNENKMFMDWTLDAEPLAWILERSLEWLHDRGYLNEEGNKFHSRFWEEWIKEKD